MADWPLIYARARDMVGPLDDGYNIGLASYWLAGLDRWGKSPQPFEAGRRSRAQTIPAQFMDDRGGALFELTLQAEKS